MGNMSTNLKVGIFILSGFAALMYMSFKIGSISLGGSKERFTFSVYFNMVSGVSEKSLVKMSGVRIGEVGEIALDRKRVKIVVLLDKTVNIPVDSVASIMSSGLLGDMFINISPGNSSMDIENGGVLEKSIDPANIDEIMQKLSTVLTDVEGISKGLGSLFSEREDEKGAVNQIVQNAEDASQLLKDILAENRKALREGLSNIRDFTGGMGDILGDNRGSFKESMDNLKDSSNKLSDIMEGLQKITHRIEGGEGTIGKLLKDEDMYENLNDTLTSAKDYMGTTETIQLGVGVRSEYQENGGDMKSYFSMRIKPREDKYYLFEISEDTRRADLSIRNTINSLLYTLIVNKRYGDVGYKVGLMESSGGVGLDYYAWRDSLIISADLFNMSGYDVNAKNPQLKIGGKYFLQKYVYFYMGSDEVLNDYYRTFYGGVGLMVDEDDFKFFIGLL